MCGFKNIFAGLFCEYRLVRIGNSAIPLIMNISVVAKSMKSNDTRDVEHVIDKN